MKGILAEVYQAVFIVTSCSYYPSLEVLLWKRKLYLLHSHLLCLYLLLTRRL